MAKIDFTVEHEFAESPARVWEAMLDWEGHGDWIPATTVDVDPGDSTVVGATFTGKTGYGPLMLIDDMVITEIDWDHETGLGSCEVEKLGPVLKGRAGFDLSPSAAGSRIVWFEDVTVPYLPAALAPLVSRVSALGFSLAMKKLAKLLKQDPARYRQELPAGPTDQLNNPVTGN